MKDTLETNLIASLEKGPVKVLLTNGEYVDIIKKSGDWWVYEYTIKRRKRTGLVKTHSISAIQLRFDSLIV